MDAQQLSPEKQLQALEVSAKGSLQVFDYVSDASSPSQYISDTERASTHSNNNDRTLDLVSRQSPLPESSSIRGKGDGDAEQRYYQARTANEVEPVITRERSLGCCGLLKAIACPTHRAQTRWIYMLIVLGWICVLVLGIIFNKMLQEKNGGDLFGMDVIADADDDYIFERDDIIKGSDESPDDIAGDDDYYYWFYNISNDTADYGYDYYNTSNDDNDQPYSYGDDDDDYVYYNDDPYGDDDDENTVYDDYDKYNLTDEYDYDDDEPVDDDIFDEWKHSNLKKILTVGEITQMLVEEEIIASIDEYTSNPTGVLKNAVDYLANVHFSFKWVLDDDTLRKQLIEKFALAALYYSTGGLRYRSDTTSYKDMEPAYRPWKKQNNWMEYPHICNGVQKGLVVPDNSTIDGIKEITEAENEALIWEGIECDDEGFVIKINLKQNALRGTLPELFSGKTLPRLRHLDLADNILNQEIPENIGTFTNLVVLDLSGNEFDSEIPNLYHNSSLEHLSLGNNFFYGTISEQFGQMSTLKTLILNSNEFSGNIPPELEYASNLEYLDLSHNYLGGGIPDSLSRLNNSLVNLNLAQNTLTGSLPSFIGELTYLNSLDLDGLALDSNSTIPSEYGKLTNLYTLDLSSNQLVGSIPSTFSNLTLLEMLSLRNNKLTGAIPSSLAGSLTNLKMLYLNENKLNNTIPSQIGQLSELNQLALQINRLTGTIPTEMGLMKNIERCRLNSNALTGIVPKELSALSKLQNLTLYGNEKLQNDIPSEICVLQETGNLSKIEIDCYDTVPCDCCVCASP